MTSIDPATSKGRVHEDIGMWVRVRGGPSAIPRPAYLCRAADMILIPGVAEVIGLANRREIPVIEVTNQAGIGRGYYGWEQFVEVEEALAVELARGGAFIDAVFACPYDSDGIGPWAHPAHPARKPRPGMLLAANRFLNVDLGSSWMVGDKESDMLAGYNAGLRGGLHVLTGHGVKNRAAALMCCPAEFEVRVGDSIRDAVGLLDSLATAR
jgi:D-glycero-D-manno-heptose 1,7-bisphosphate phosphatase